MTYRLPDNHPLDDYGMSRRRFVLGLGAAAAAGALGLWRPQQAWALDVPGAARSAAVATVPPTDQYRLVLAPGTVDVTGRATLATTVNGSVPGPILHWREGDTVTVRVTNNLPVSSSIHWHGILVPNPMDGVPGINFAGIAPGETFTYRFPVRQSGTYWYHSHSGFQEQTGLAGPLIISPRGPDPVRCDRDYVVMLSDWTDEDPEAVYEHLKKLNGYYNYHQRTVGDFFADVQRRGWGATVADRLAWGLMRMSPHDIADVTGATYTYLINGRPPAGNWTGLFRPGERVRLRFINGSAMTYFDVRIPGLKMTVVAADGNNVHPVTVDEFRIAVAETYDVIVEPTEETAYTIFAQAMDRSGYARGTLTPRANIIAPVPAMDPRFERGMRSMGMAMKPGTMGGMEGMPPAQATSGMGDMPGMDRAAAPRAGYGPVRSHLKAATAPINAWPQPRDVHLQTGPEVSHIAAQPWEGQGRPGDGLGTNGRRTLTYADLVRLEHGPQNGPFPPDHYDAEIELHLTGNMERYIFGFNGKTYEQSDPVRLPYGRRIRVTLINDTMMAHPIHLHGMWSELDNGAGRLRPLKQTVNVEPGQRLHYFVTADALGRWAYHCHLLYHMEAGMFTTAVVA